MARTFTRNTARPAARPPVSRPLRRSQMISPFGVGAISDFRDDESLMCAGLDEWFGTDGVPDHLRLDEPRLQRRLNRAFFVRPPELRGEDGRSRRIPFVRFPRWHYCPRCARMSKAGYFSADRPWCDPCEGRRRRMIPVRIVAACELGHIEDFPFRQWIDCQCASDEQAQLRFRAGQSSAGLAGILVSCDACGKKRSLAGAMQPDVLKTGCAGARPWLGQDACGCGDPLKAVQRGGSNVYFPLVISSIFIPDHLSTADQRVEAVLDRNWSFLTSSLVDGELDPMRIGLVAEQRNVDAARLSELGGRRLRGEDGDAVATDEETFRQQEYALLRTSQTDPLTELVTDWVDGREYGVLAPFIEGVGLVHRLRETRVLAGFSRLKPRNEGSGGIQPIALPNGDVDWLPAIDVYGEGIFISFRQELLADWSDRRVVRDRLREPVAALDRVRASRGEAASGAHPRQVFLHTFAHAFMKELAYTCGYGSSSLRERLYVDVAQPDHPMAGVLIYTAAGDSDGTLGGLVAQGAPGQLQGIIVEALRRSAWCSNDPVCLEGASSSPDTANVAACHSCALVPETSCENGNRLLDRGTLVGTPEQPGIGFLTLLMPGYIAA